MTSQSIYNRSSKAEKERYIRSVVRKSSLTRAQQPVVLKLCNLWFHHESGPEGVIRASQKYIAKQCRVSVPTVYRTLSLLEKAGALVAVKYPRGGKRPTHYKMNLTALLALFGQTWPERLEKYGEFDRKNTELYKSGKLESVQPKKKAPVSQPNSWENAGKIWLKICHELGLTPHQNDGRIIYNGNHYKTEPNRAREKKRFGYLRSGEGL